MHDPDDGSSSPVRSPVRDRRDGSEGVETMSEYVSTGMWWFSLALVNAGLAQSKGRSGWYWFLFSLFLGPVATFLIVVWPPRTGTT
jgi:hypothetical protein